MHLVVLFQPFRLAMVSLTDSGKSPQFVFNNEDLTAFWYIQFFEVGENHFSFLSFTCSVDLKEFAYESIPAFGSCSFHAPFREIVTIG